MKPSSDAIALITNFEGFRSKPYLCPAGKWTIGYGHTHGVTPDMPEITMREAIDLLNDDLKSVAFAINSHVVGLITQSEFDALCSFVFNVGIGAFIRSTLLKKLNAGDVQGASEEFCRWIFSNGLEFEGLRRRREAEKMLFTRGWKKGGNNA